MKGSKPKKMMPMKKAMKKGAKKEATGDKDMKGRGSMMRRLEGKPL